VKYVSALRCARAAIPFMKAQGWGRIINISGTNARNAGNLSGGDSPRGNAIGRMVDASEIAYLTAFLASDKAWAVTGELVVATGGAGRSVYY
jgi:NAD(P)-dependent dehydrogenase (short-subunit alcohol dehydrogenase family)